MLPAPSYENVRAGGGPSVEVSRFEVAATVWIGAAADRDARAVAVGVVLVAAEGTVLDPARDISSAISLGRSGRNSCV